MSWPSRLRRSQAIPDVNGVEMADRWGDVINWRYLGYRGKGGDTEDEFVPDRNAGIWKPVWLYVTGPVKVSSPWSTPISRFPRLICHIDGVCDGFQWLSGPRCGADRGNDFAARQAHDPDEASHLAEWGETRELIFDAALFPQLAVHQPDLWWPVHDGTAQPVQPDLKLRRRGKLSIARPFNSAFAR